MSPKHCSSAETLPSSQQSTDYIKWMLPLQEYKPFLAPCLLLPSSGAVPRMGHGIWGVRKGITPDNSSDVSREGRFLLMSSLPHYSAPDHVTTLFCITSSRLIFLRTCHTLKCPHVFICSLVCCLFFPLPPPDPNQNKHFMQAEIKLLAHP